MKYLLCIPTIVLWGLNPVLTRLCSTIVGIQPYIIVTGFLSCLSTTVITSIIYKNVWTEINLQLFRYHDDIFKRWALTLTDSILCLSLPMIIYNVLLSDTHNIALVVTTTWYGAPLLTTVISIFVFKQYLTKLQSIGLLVCILGILMMNWEDIYSNYKNREYKTLKEIRSDGI